jgi:flagellar biogenesis protein FliO
MSTAVLIVRFVIAVIVLTGLLGLCAAWMRRSRVGGTRSELEVVARRPLGKTSSVAIVRAGTQTVLIGVTDGQVSLLLDELEFDEHELDEHELDEHEPARASSAMRNPRRTVTRSPRILSAPRTASSAGASASGSPWTMALHALRERTVRRA